MNKKFVQFVSLLLVLLLMVPLTASAEDGGGNSWDWIFSGSNGSEDSGEEETPEEGTPEEDVPEEDVSEEEVPSEEELPEDDPDAEEEEDPFADSSDEDESDANAETGDGRYTGIGGQIIRVGIYYGDAGKESVTLTLTKGDGFRFGYYDSSNGETFVEETSVDLPEITVTADDNMIYVTDPDTDELLYEHDQEWYDTGLGIEPYSLDGELTVTKCGYPYYGGFRFECFENYDGTMTIVNMVPLDDYVKGVVPYEMSPSWHIEALKTQAVCARSYALSHISAKHRKNFSFDLCDGDCCQVYKGVYSGSYVSAVHEAVDSTSGLVLMYDGAYCDTVYSSSNGGGSEASKNVWGKDIPYLQGVADPYEATIADRISNYSWSVTFTGEELQAKLVASGRVSCGIITEVKTTLSETDNVIALTFVDDNDKSWTIYNTDSGGSKCRTFLSLRSIHYTVSSETGSETVEDNFLLVNGGEILDVAEGITVINGDGTISTITEGYIITGDGLEELGTGSSNATTSASGNVFTFSGSGWGHNVGMSQWGAYAMAELGYTYDEILEFYYTGAMIEQC